MTITYGKGFTIGGELVTGWFSLWRLRRKYSVELGDKLHIGDNVSIGIGTTVMDDTKIGNNVIIGKDVYIGNKCFIGHHTLIESHTRVHSNAILMERCIIRMYSKIEASCTLRNRVILNDGATLGASSILGDNVFLGKSILSRVTIPSNRVIDRVFPIEIGEDPYVHIYSQGYHMHGHKGINGNVYYINDHKYTDIDKAINAYRNLTAELRKLKKLTVE